MEDALSSCPILQSYTFRYCFLRGEVQYTPRTSTESSTAILGLAVVVRRVCVLVTNASYQANETTTMPVPAAADTLASREVDFPPPAPFAPPSNHYQLLLLSSSTLPPSIHTTRTPFHPGKPFPPSPPSPASKARKLKKNFQQLKRMNGLTGVVHMCHAVMPD